MIGRLFATLAALALILGASPASAQVVGSLFQSATDLGNNGGTTNNLTHSFTVPAGTNQILIVAIQGDLISNANDDISSVTFNGVTMGLAGKNTTAVSHPGSDRYMYEYCLAAPAQGTFNVSISSTTTHWLFATAAIYQGVAGCTPDAAATNTSATSPMTTGLTTTHNDLVVVAGAGDGSGSGSGCYASTNLTVRVCGSQYGEPSILDNSFAAGTLSPIVSAPTGSADLMTVAVAYQLTTTQAAVSQQSNSVLLQNNAGMVSQASNGVLLQNNAAMASQMSIGVVLQCPTPPTNGTCIATGGLPFSPLTGW